jgi:hypothetical protein
VVPVESDTVSVTTASANLVGSSITMGVSTVGSLRGVQEFSILVHATAAFATKNNVEINARTLLAGTVADGTALTFLGSTTVTDGKAAGLSLATVIRDRCTELETTWSTVMATAAEGVKIHCAVRDNGAGPDGCALATVVTTKASTAMTSTNTIMCYNRYSKGIIDFEAADLISTNSSAKGFRVVVTTTAEAASAMPISAIVLREPSAYSPIKGYQSISTLHAT